MDTMEASNMAYVVLKEMTDGFREDLILGRGSFGVVYKGVDKNGQELAVKVFHPMIGLDDKEFRRELKNLAKLKHQNIVQLVGFCNDEEEIVVEHNGRLVRAVKMHRALCFEYVHNGSLRKHLSDVRQGLGWRTRYKIIKGICEGLKYLHTGLEVPVYHFDLKPDNILLDENMVPKIADFGLSRIFGEEKTRQTISSLGTLGYMPPEFVRLQIISEKFDIFSLGVIIIKIMIGPMGYSHTDEMEPAEFVEHVHNIWRETLQLITGYTSIEIDCQQVKTCIEVALKCLEEKRHKRPSIEDIVRELSETEKNTNDPGSQIGQFHDAESILPKSDISDRPFAGNFVQSTIKGESSRQNNMENKHPSTLPRELTLQFLQGITNNFSSEREIGRGAFGVVYKGIHENGEVVAVKKLVRTSGVHDRRFRNEVNNLLVLEHKNIVKLIGSSCQVERKAVEQNGKYVISDVPEKLLCYEYLSNGSLEDYIYDESCGLDWPMRFKIIIGICNGLHFLHEELTEPIVHLNLKPSNILLDKDMVPKIADFGLSRLFGQEQTRILTQNVVGWIGYIAPEYHYRGEISVKSDIFSLGVLILEIVTGLKKDPNSQDISSKLLIDNVRKTWTKEMHIASKYPSLEADYHLQVTRCIEIGLNCVEADPKKRPSAREIISKLNVVGKEIKDEASIHIENKPQPISTLPAEPTFQFFESITRNFSVEREIGRGSFGVVYKGVLENEEVVAVKKLLEIPGIIQDKQFQNEVGNLIAVNHRNIVKLMGYCYEIRRKVVESNGRHIVMDMAEKLLCYEYLPGGSLDKYLYDESRELSWNTRFKIIEGICQGLQFLHKLPRVIIHMNLKPGNILLDDNMVPKIADFGLSRLFGQEQTRTLTLNVVASRGYMAPEYYYRGEISTKSDIFNLGVLIIEIVTGLNVNLNNEDVSSKHLIDDVRKNWTKIPHIASKYPSLEAHYLQQVERCIGIGLTCVNTNPKDRPSIGEVLNKLSGSSASSSMD